MAIINSWDLEITVDYINSRLETYRKMIEDHGEGHLVYDAKYDDLQVYNVFEQTEDDSRHEIDVRHVKAHLGKNFGGFDLYLYIKWYYDDIIADKQYYMHDHDYWTKPCNLEEIPEFKVLEGSDSFQLALLILDLKRDLIKTRDRMRTAREYHEKELQQKQKEIDRLENLLGIPF